jgi:hypothetical protein
MDGNIGTVTGINFGNSFIEYEGEFGGSVPVSGEWGRKATHCSAEANGGDHTFVRSVPPADMGVFQTFTTSVRLVFGFPL